MFSGNGCQSGVQVGSHLSTAYSLVSDVDKDLALKLSLIQPTIWLCTNMNSCFVYEPIIVQA